MCALFVRARHARCLRVHMLIVQAMYQEMKVESALFATSCDRARDFSGTRAAAFLATPSRALAPRTQTGISHLGCDSAALLAQSSLQTHNLRSIFHVSKRPD